MPSHIGILRFISIILIFCASHFAFAQELPGPPKSYSPNKHALVAVLQWAPEENAPVGKSYEVIQKYMQKNRNTLADYIHTAHNNGAQYVLTPELSVIAYPEEDYTSREDIAPFTETIPGPSTRFFSELSKKLKIYIQFGIAEADLKNRYYNATVVTDPDGKIAATYRKINLFWGENRYFDEGTYPATFLTPFGKIGLIICADIYNTYPISAYHEAGVETLSMGASWTVPNPMNLFTSVAGENVMNLMAANHPYFPDSGVINKDGSVQSHIRKTQGLAYGYFKRK